MQRPYFCNPEYLRLLRVKTLHGTSLLSFAGTDRLAPSKINFKFRAGLQPSKESLAKPNPAQHPDSYRLKPEMVTFGSSPEVSSSFNLIVITFTSPGISET